MKRGHLTLTTSNIRIEAAAGSDPLRPRPFEMVAYTGGFLKLPNWSHPVVVDLSGIQLSQPTIPALYNHQSSAMEDGVGRIDRATSDGSSLVVAGVLTPESADPPDHALRIIRKHDNGYRWQSSIGADVLEKTFIPEGRTVTANGQTFAGPFFLAHKAVLQEVSWVHRGADDRTSATIAATSQQRRVKANAMTFEEFLAGLQLDAASLSPELLAQYQALYQKAHPAPADPPPADAAAIPAAPSPAAGVAASAGSSTGVNTIDASAAAQYRRLAEINAKCGQYPQIAASAIEQAWDDGRIDAEIALHTLRSQRPAAPAPARGNTPNAITARAVEASLLMAAGIDADGVAKMGFSQEEMNRAVTASAKGGCRGMTIQGLMDQTIAAAGDHFGGSRKENDYIRAALAADRKIKAANFSTVSLSNILENVANKTLLNAYETVATVWEEICAVRSHTDFKTYARYRLDLNGSFRKVGPDGELKHVGLSDAKYTSTLETYGMMISLTRQMIINDDLGSFAEIPRSIGVLAAQRIEEAVFTLLLSNPSSFFSSGNGNLVTGTTGALSIGGLTRMVNAYNKLVDSNGRPILSRVERLLVPSGREIDAGNLINPTDGTVVTMTTTADTVGVAANPHKNKFRVISSPYLDNTSIKNEDGVALTGQSDTAYYGFSNPAVRPAMGVAFLNGQRTPTIEQSETSFETLGMEWRAYLDFGVGMEDPKGAIKVTGAA